MAVAKPNLLFSSNMKKWAYKLSGFNQYGLWRDDCLYETPEVKEALRRLPQKIVDERTFRIVRAMQLSCCKTILPVEQWTKYEEDVLYLQPYLKEIMSEIKEKEDWNKE